MGKCLVKQHDDGTWYAQPYLGTNRVTGKKIRPYKRFPTARCEKEAQELADAWFASECYFLVGMKTTKTVSDCVRAYIDDGLAAWKPATIKTYRTALKMVVEPYIGDMCISDVNASVVRSWHSSALRGINSNAVSSATVAQAHSLLSGAWNQFCADGLVDYNPFLGNKPRVMHIEAVAYDRHEVADLTRALISAMASDGVDAANVKRRMVAFAAYMSLVTGARCGEVCGLVATDIRKSGKFIDVVISKGVTEATGKPVVQTTKGGKTRIVPVDEVSAKQIERHLAWLSSVVGKDPGRTTHVVTLDGGVVRPSYLSSSFSALRDDLELPKDTHFHTLRHTHATMLLESGANVKIIQERLGHSDIRTTLALYAHIMPGAGAAAAEAFGSQLEVIHGGKGCG